MQVKAGAKEKQQNFRVDQNDLQLNSANQSEIHKHLLLDDHSLGMIDRETQIKLGAFLTNLMCHNLKYKVGRKEYLLLKPQLVRSVGSVKTIGHIVFEKGFVETFVAELDKIHDLNLQIERAVPMIYKPAPWKNYFFGGYYLRQTKMAKVLPQFREAIKYMTKADLSQVCSVLDTLGAVEWRVNKRVLEIVEHVWSIGGGLGKIPKRFVDRVITPEMIRDASYREKLKLLKEYQKNNEEHALRCEFLLRLRMTQSFKSCGKIYFPHNMDFRGRVYPIPPHLNHMGQDLNRGLLEFSKGKPLGKTGLYWLKVHLANTIGHDKLPLDERAAYSESIMDTIHRCAADPKNNLEWLESEDPWQALACMFEVSNAVKSGDPENYVSNLHVHVDGSCNGMQHYAAFGRDENAGRKLNLADSERPGDVYSAILKLVLQDIENESNQELIEVAESLRGNVTRKVIKQTVMTSVYGVTFIGAR